MSGLYPVNVDIPQEQIDALISLFSKYYNRIVKEIETATDFGVSNRKKILAQIESTLEQLGEKSQTFINKNLPNYYRSGADDAISQLNNIGAEINVETGFNQLHKDAIIALVDDTVQSQYEAITGVNRSVNRLLSKGVRDLVTQEIAYGVTTGGALDKVRKQIKGILIEQGLPALTDRAGKKIQLGNYAEMLFRTKAVEARNMGLANRLMENNYDLVQVSSHASSCPLCVPWQGEILSISGKTAGYKTYNQAINGGLFHPNCRHAVNALIPSLARNTKAYDPSTGKYGGPGATVKAGIGKVVNSEILDPAKSYQKEFEKNVAKVAKDGGWEYKFGPLKNYDRSLEKVMADYNGDVMRLKDANRSVLFIDNPYDAKEFTKMVESTRSVFGNATVKSGLDVTEGYAKSMINVKAPDGHIVELQVTTSEMWKAKKDLGGDSLYDIVRVQAEGWVEANDRMQALYADARAEIASRLGL